MYTELIKIIEGGINRDPKKVISYAKHLAKKLKEDGDVKLGDKILQLLEGSKGLPVYKDALFESPVDQDTRLNIADVIMPNKIEVDVLLSESISAPIENFVSLVNSKNIIVSKGLDLRLSLLLYGPPGCGKTTLAKHIAKELDLPIIIARFDSLISSLLGNTAKNIRQLFDYAKNKPCILFIDEFDAIAKARNDTNETGELKRVINSLLQNIDDFLENGILIAATNHESLLDKAIWRRFEKVVHVGPPSQNEINQLLLSYFEKFQSDLANDSKRVSILSESFRSFSHSEVVKVLNSAYYNSIVYNKSFSSQEILTELFKYKSNNRFSTDDLVRFLNESSVPQKNISDHLKISVRKVRNALNQE